MILASVGSTAANSPARAAREYPSITAIDPSGTPAARAVFLHTAFTCSCAEADGSALLFLALPGCPNI